MLLSIPNLLTLSRMAMLPVFLLLFSLEESWGAWAAWLGLFVYILCALTDFLDGYLARKWNQISALGTFLDPISDKIFVACLLVMLAGYGRLPDFWMVPALIILAREFLISGLREYLGPQDIKLPVTVLAKWKTAAQMLSLGFLIIGPFIPYGLIIGLWLLNLAALLTVITGLGYARAALKLI
jgi:cardiolipin synthase